MNGDRPGVVTAPRPTASGAALDPADFAPRRRPPVLRWVLAVVVLVLLADLVRGAITNPRLSWDVVGEYLFDARILHGLLITLGLTAVSQVVATVLGLLVALAGLSGNPVLVAVARLYVTVFRTVPTIVQMLFWYYLAAIVPYIGVGLPFGPDLVVFDSTKIITQFAAAVLGLALGEAAFLAEYFRGGITAVPRGQLEAAAACGLTPVTTFRRIVAPQALRIVLPAYGNALIINLKNTSTVFVIGAGDMMTQAQLIYTQNFQQIPLLVVVILWYLLVVAALTAVQRRVEAHYGRGYGEAQPSGRDQLRRVLRRAEGAS